MEEEDEAKTENLAPIRSRTQPAVVKRLNRAFGPIAAGMIIDLVDLATFGPIGLVFGLPVGGVAGFWMGRCLGLSKLASFYCAIAAGIYCTIPFTEAIPLATLVGAYARFRESGREQKSEKNDPGA